MAIFSKTLRKDANRLFTKASGHVKNFGKYARQADNTIARAGHFLANTADELGFNNAASAIRGGVQTAHRIRNDLEKSSRVPVGQLRDEMNPSAV